MRRFLTSFAAIPLLLATASAQCFEQSFGVLCPFAGGAAGYGDDVLFDLQPMNISFPMGGLATTYSHAHICENGIVYLTNGAPTTGPTYAYQATPVFLGAAAADPRIAPMFMDLESAPAFGGGVFVNNTIPGKFVVTWSNMVEWATQGPAFTFQAQLFANGDVTFYYGPTAYGAAAAAQLVCRCGVSEGNGVIDPGVTDLSLGAGFNGTSFVMYEEFPVGIFDLQDSSVNFTYIGTGYVQQVGPCTPAYHQNYGSGCYDISDSFYQLLPDATTAPALNGQSMVMTPVGNDYLVTWGGGAFVTPVAAAPLGLTDDGEAAQALSTPFPTAAGPIGTVYVAANGLISMAANPSSGIYVPDADTLLNSPVLAFSSHHDFNPTEAGSGQVTYFEAVTGAGTIAYFTWDSVENYPTGVVNPSTMQFQLNLTTGAVTYVWQTMDGDPSSIYGSGHVIGWSPAGPSSDGGSLTLATALPFLTNPTNVVATALSASPAPISAAAGSVITYTTTNMRETAPGLYVGMNIISLNQVPGGIDLGVIGAPGCDAYVATLDFNQAMVGVTSTNSVSLALPPLLPAGTQLFSQSIGLIPPFSLPSGQNAFGLTASNGVKTYISSF